MKKIPSHIFLHISFILFLGLILPFHLAAINADAEDDSVQRITFLSSYSLTFPTVTRQVSGVDDALGSSDIVLSYEFMDSKELDNSTDIERFTDYLEYKWERIGKPDALIVGDDNALQLVLSKRNTMFKDIPVVFLGIDDLDSAKKAHNLNMTGVTETGPIKTNIDLARKIYPSAKRILAVVDDSQSGKGAQYTISQMQQYYPDIDIVFMNTSKLSRDEICSSLQKLDTDTILIYYIFSEDKNGIKYSAAEGAKILFPNSSVPVFYYQIGVGSGSLGGVQVDFEESGRLAGEMALKVLDGTPCSSIDVVYDTPTKLVFDYSVVKKYHIKRSRLPLGSEFINYDKTAIMRKVLLIVCFVIIILIIVMFLLFRDNSLSHRHEMMLLKQQGVLQREADHDELTALRNRRFLMKSLEDCVSTQQPITLIELDIDYFKKINDTYGHPAGDAILRELASRMITLQNDDTGVFRYGGDEFCIILHNTDAVAAADCAQKLFDLCNDRFIISGGRSIDVTLSIGLARYPEDGKDIASLIACADAALYSVKRSGKNSIRNYKDIA